MLLDATVGNWFIGFRQASSIELDNLASGTIVIWTDPDRIIPAATKAENENAERKFLEALFDRVKKHLSMTFHRFLEAKSVAIHWCGHEIDPWNPFCPKESKVQIMPSEQIGEQVTVKGYILPHKTTSLRRLHTDRPRESSDSPHTRDSMSIAETVCYWPETGWVCSAKKRLINWFEYRSICPIAWIQTGK